MTEPVELHLCEMSGGLLPADSPLPQAVGGLL